MKINLLSLLNGVRKEIEFDYSLVPDSPLLAGVSFPEPISVSGKITNRAGYMQIRLAIGYRYTAECARCLAPVSREGKIDAVKGVCEEKQLKNEEEQDEFLIIRSDELDPDEAVYELVFQELPYRELCKEDCKGLCSVCGRNLNEGDCGCKRVTVDSGLSVLKELLDKADE